MGWLTKNELFFIDITQSDCDLTIPKICSKQEKKYDLFFHYLFEKNSLCIWLYIYHFFSFFLYSFTSTFSFYILKKKTTFNVLPSFNHTVYKLVWMPLINMTFLHNENTYEHRCQIRYLSRLMASLLLLSTYMLHCMRNITLCHS